MKTIILAFEGYWLDPPKSPKLERSGVYCVYACKYSKESDKVDIRKILYIGESSDVQSRLQNHDRYDDWKDQLKSGEALCFSFAPVQSVDRERAEAALIFEHQPPLNDEHTGHFIYEDTEIEVSGRGRYLSPQFTIHKGATK